MKECFNLELFEYPPRFYLKNNFDRCEIFVDEDFSQIIQSSSGPSNAEEDAMETNQDNNNEMDATITQNIASGHILKTSSYRSYTQRNVHIPIIFGWNHKNMIEQSKTFFLKLILSFIDLKCESVAENDLLEFLSDLKFPKNTRLDSVIGECYILILIFLFL